MKLKLPAGEFAAYLFRLRRHDCGFDAAALPGVEEGAGEWNCDFSEELFYAWGGMPVTEVISTLNRERGLQMPVEQVGHRKENLYFELLPQLRAYPGSSGSY